MVDSLRFYDKGDAELSDLEFPDVFFTPEYGAACEHSDGCQWELCRYKDLLYVYLKREYRHCGTVFYDLISPYGYSGYHFTDSSTMDEFIPLFRKAALERNYITEVVRQNPYCGTSIGEYYDEIVTRSIFSAEVTSYDDYFDKLSSKTRNIVRKVRRTQNEFSVENCDDARLSAFVSMYRARMGELDASSYYFFDDSYFAELSKVCKVATVTNSGRIVGQSLLMFFNDFIHYHLSCSDYSSNLTTNFLLDSVLREYGVGRKLILGGGLKDEDSLYRFKKKISTRSYDYTIFKNVINQEVYDKINSGSEGSSRFPAHR